MHPCWNKLDQSSHDDLLKKTIPYSALNEQENRSEHTLKQLQSQLHCHKNLLIVLLYQKRMYEFAHKLQLQTIPCLT